MSISQIARTIGESVTLKMNETAAILRAGCSLAEDRTIEPMTLEYGLTWIS